MDAALHRFIRFLRLQGVRLSVAEVTDAAMACASGAVLADRDYLRSALAITLIKDRRDLPVFDATFDKFFGLKAVLPPAPPEHSHAHDDLSDEGDLDAFTLSDEPGDSPQQGHSHGKPVDLHKFFNPEDMAEQYNLHQEANRLDMSSMTDEVVVSKDSATSAAQAARIQISTSHLHNPGTPGKLASKPGLAVDVDLSVAEEQALLSWLGDEDDDPEQLNLPEPDVARLASLIRELAPLLENLPQALVQHLQALLASEISAENAGEDAAGTIDPVLEAQRQDLEDSLRVIIRSLRGSPRPRRQVSPRGVIDSRRTMRGNMKYEGVPFRPVTVAKKEDRPKLVVLCDVSLSVRATSLFTLSLVHGLAMLAPRIRTFAFVDEVAEITDLFAEFRIDTALNRVMAAKNAGGVLDVDADSNYGAVWQQFLDDYGSALSRRTTVVILGDGRGNANDPGMEAFIDLSRRVRSVLWLTPEPQFSWGLGACDLPLYAEHCDRVRVVRGLKGLAHVRDELHEAHSR